MTYDELLADLMVSWIDPDTLWSEWLFSLKNGPYVQGHKALLRDGKYCSLGVLCTVAGIKPVASIRPDGAMLFAGRRACLPDALAAFLDITRWAGFKHAVPALRRYVPREEYPAGSVVSLNDTAQWSFSDQARYLEDHRDNMRAWSQEP